MAELKTKATNASVSKFLEGVTDDERRDAEPNKSSSRRYYRGDDGLFKLSATTAFFGSGRFAFDDAVCSAVTRWISPRSFEICSARSCPPSAIASSSAALVRLPILAVMLAVLNADA
jgi:hypothetical protein